MKENTTTNFIEIKRTMHEYYEQLYINKLHNLGEIDKFLEQHTNTKS